MKPYEIEAVSSEASLHQFSMDDYLDAAALWRDTPGVGMGDSDQPGAIAAFLARKLVQASLDALADAGIVKCHLMVYADNAPGQEFWRSVGASERMELDLYSLAAAMPAPAGRS